jgi:hypothetical protein
LSGQVAINSGACCALPCFYLCRLSREVYNDGFIYAVMSLCVLFSYFIARFARFAHLIITR